MSTEERKIELIKGDITKMKVDAIVNAANTELMLGGGLAGTIRRKGGTSIQEECNKHGPVPLGGAALTGAGNLPARYIIHAASMSLGKKTTAESLRNATRNSLRLAEENNIKTIAFPAIGTGVGKFPIEECAEIMLQEVSSFLEKSSVIQKVFFVLYGNYAYNTFKKVYDKIFKEAT
ncbi:macro domain-containing protein [Candidatus Sumerlaeota bacterium]|nr:macro domain-containing protein [Candidatus Sumerlaeota bacterium]